MNKTICMSKAGACINCLKVSIIPAYNHGDVKVFSGRPDYASKYNRTRHRNRMQD